MSNSTNLDHTHEPSLCNLALIQKLSQSKFQQRISLICASTNHCRLVCLSHKPRMYIVSNCYHQEHKEYNKNSIICFKGCYKKTVNINLYLLKKQTKEIKSMEELEKNSSLVFDIIYLKIDSFPLSKEPEFK